MTRSLLLTLVLAVSCLGAATAAYLTGRASGPDLSVVARSATSNGDHSGARAGSSAGQRVGFRAGYSAGYQHAYPLAYQAAYRQAVRR